MMKELGLKTNHYEFDPIPLLRLTIISLILFPSCGVGWRASEKVRVLVNFDNNLLIIGGTSYRNYFSQGASKLETFAIRISSVIRDTCTACIHSDNIYKFSNFLF